jgi:hypothetical protein
MCSSAGDGVHRLARNGKKEGMSRAHEQSQSTPGESNQLSSQRWVERELSGCTFKDKRLARRLRTILTQMASKPGSTIPLACQDWAGTKAAYRFFDNARVDEAEILEGHFRATLGRMPHGTEPVLVIHDTTEFPTSARTSTQSARPQLRSPEGTSTVALASERFAEF